MRDDPMGQNDPQKLMVQAARALILAIESDRCVGASIVFITDEGVSMFNASATASHLIPLLGAVEVAKQEILISHMQACAEDPNVTDEQRSIVHGLVVGRS